MNVVRHHIQDLAELPEERAHETYFSELGWGRLFWWMRFSVLVLVGWFGAISDEAFSWRQLLPVLDALLVLTYFLARRRGLEARPFLRFGYGFLVAQTVLVRLAFLGYGEGGSVFGPFDFMVPGLLLIFPLPFGFMLGLFGLFWVPLLVLAGGLELASGSGNHIGEMLGYSMYLAMLFGFSRFLYRRRVRSFLESWQRARVWALEGKRMRSELDQARIIQLSMLPQHDPYSPWLDIAGASRPATEVGGDYYGFFDVGEGRQAVVVADVAGHGVASGLLLAGVRGCLVMLHEKGEKVPAPQVLLGRLNRVVQTVGGRRTFVTMAYTLFERSPLQLTMAAAGHPPLLRWRARDGEIEEIALPSLPLGTHLPTSFPETSQAVDSGDVFVFATDGIAEAAGPDGNLFGEERLFAAIKRVALGATAAEIRDALLGELEGFLGAREGQDDVTLVVVRVKG